MRPSRWVGLIGMDSCIIEPWRYIVVTIVGRVNGDR